jgi:Ca2+-binding RTX toxin-like protein
MASVNFSPIGTQLDNDEIVDLQATIDDSLGFSFILDTSGLDANLQSIKLRLEGDSTEVNLSDTLTDFFETTFPDVAVVEDNSDGDFISVVVELKGEPGAVPNTTNVLVQSEATVLDGLANDGATDIGVTVVEAIDVNGTDVTEKFVPSQQTIDLQPFSPVQAIFGTPENDPIIGTPQNELIVGNEGNDLIIDNEGNDNSFGDGGNDLFFDNTGNDTIRGGAGNDFVIVDSDSGGDDSIDLGKGNNLAFGGTGADIFVLNRDSGVTGIGDFTTGEDRFALGENLTQDDLNFVQLDNEGLGSLTGSTLITDADTGKAIAFVGATSVEAVSNAEFINAGDVLRATQASEETSDDAPLPTDDSSSTTEESPEPIEVELPPAQSGEIFGTPDPDVLVGDDGTNLILPGGDNNFVNAGGGEDRVFGEENTNIFNGEAGNDLLNGGVDGDILNGGEGDDTLLGETANDIFNVLNGDDGNDLLVGGSNSDAIYGGRGDDLLFGGLGNDGLLGNEGRDTFVFTPGEGADIVFDFESGEDAIALTTDSSYDSLNIEYNAQGNYANVSDETGELITTLVGVETDQLTESNFTTI